MDENQQPIFERKILTTQKCLSWFIGGVVATLASLLPGLVLFHFHIPASWVFIAIAIAYASDACKNWMRYAAARNGATIYAPDGKGNPIEMLLGLTAIVAAWTYFTIWTIEAYLLYSPRLLVMVIVSDVLLWAITLREWYRLLFRRPKAIPPAGPQEGVWPPPPVRSDDAARG